MRKSTAKATLKTMSSSSSLLTILGLLLSTFPPLTTSDLPPLYPKAALPTESGYLPINSSSSSAAAALFFAFYEAQKPLSPLASTPLLVWLQGGPGCSSMVGNLFELGPWLISDDLLLSPNPFSWNRRFALLFIDSPLGTGFSSASSPVSIPGEQPTVAAHLFSAIQSFLSSHPLSFRSRPLFLTGESYAGKYVPAAAYHILRQNPIFPPPLRINLAGVAIGNGLTHPTAQIGTHASAAYFAGLINDRQRAKLEDLQNDATALARAGKWLEAADARGLVLEWLQNATGLATLYDLTKKKPYATAKLTVFLNREEVKAALGAKKETTWVECSKAVSHVMKKDIMKSVKFMVEEVVKNSRVLLYQGIFDLRDGVASTEAWMKEMNWEGIGSFLDAERRVWRVEGEVAGYLQKWGNLTHVVVSGAGHLVPADQGRSTQAMIEGWVLKSGDFGEEEEEEKDFSLRRSE
ncbi:serine carboxypeptidase-like 50 [Dendrobium catenatum]|uniref:serine carboxypeptidase-like 50 n=1 Tax=Dendrobium catenatum TaxID=906689 RepID=UPI00109F5C15|nr:serine carboxypeptidase-like 50 [Dendrobium catenatum]